MGNELADVFWRARRRWRRVYARARDSELPVTLLVFAVTVGFLLGLWVSRGWIPEQPGAAPESDRAQLAEAPDRRPASHPAHAGRTDSTSARLGRCEEVYAAEARPLEDLRPAMTQWEVHIGAMNKLVLGTITLEQAQEFWNHTRVGAARTLAAYDDAQRAFQQRTARCPSPAGPTSAALRACVAVVGARQRELDRGAVALETWRTHVRHMEMLRRGEMSPAEATQMWLVSWREGRRQVDAYRSAARAAERAAGAHRHHGDGNRPCAG